MGPEPKPPLITACTAESGDLAHLVAFLASPLVRYFTGEVLHVDGGMRRFAH